MNLIDLLNGSPLDISMRVLCIVLGICLGYLLGVVVTAANATRIDKQDKQMAYDRGYSKGRREWKRANSRYETDIKNEDCGCR